MHHGPQRAEFAYALNATQEGNIATFSFKVTGDVTDSRIILTSSSSYGTVEIPVGEVTAATGASVKHDMSTLAGHYTWSVEVTSAPIASSGRFVDIKDNRTSAFRGGVVCITDPESDAYGYTVIGSAKGKGFMVFDQTGAKVGEGYQATVGNPSHSSSPYRGGQLDGKAIFSDYSDAYSAYYVFDPLNPETTVSNLLAADGFSRITSSAELTGTGYTAGIWKNGTTYSGGNATSAAFYKDAEGTHLITFGEDIGDKLVRYTLDANGLISSAPDKVYTDATDLLGSKNCDVITTEYGFFASNLNVVTNGTGNTEAKPAFIFCDYEGNVKFNSSTITNLTSSYSAIAVTKDLDMIAVLGHSAANSGNLRLLFYSVTWANGVPSFTQVNAFAIPSATATVGWASLRFDPAGNLWAYFDHYGYRAYGLQNAAPKATTPAKAANTVRGTLPTATRAMAYDLVLSKAGSYYVLDYYLTADAKNVTFQFYGTTPEDTKTVDLGSKTAGYHREEISIYDFPISDSEDEKDHRNYVWNVDVTSYPTDNFYQLDNYADDTSKGFGGVVPITDPTSPWFGYSVTARGLGGKISLYAPDYTLKQSFKPTCFSDAYPRSPWRGTWYNGYVYFADAVATTSGIYRVDLNNFNTNPTQVFSGTRETTSGQFTLPDANIVGGRISGLDFQGTGENTKLWAFESYKEILVRYDLGTDLTAEELNGPFSISKGRTTVIDGNPYFKYTLVEVTAIEDGVFASHRTVDGSGKVTVDDTHVGLIYMKNDGTVAYNSTTTNLLPSYNSGFAINAARNIAAIGQYNDNIVVFSVDWTADGVPSFTKIGEILNTAAEMAQLRFDAAGNLHAYLVGKGYHVYSVPAAEAVTTTKYRLTVINNGTVSSADDIEVAPATDEPARIFNLQGIEMHGELAPGIYIRRTATKSEKFIVR